MIAAESHRKPARGWRLVWVPVAVALLGIGWVGWHREPSYQGRSLGAWLAAAQSGEETAAAEAIEAMGDRCLPGLVRRLGTVDSRLRGWLEPVVGERGARRLFGAAAHELRAQALWGFQQLGARAAPALPRLLTLLRKRALPEMQQAVLALGEPAVPALTAWLSEPDPGHRFWAAALLGRMGVRAAAAAPALTARLQDGSPQVRQYAAMALADLGDAGRPALPQLEALLGHGTEDDALAAAYGQSRIRGGSWVPLLRAVSAPSRPARVAGAAALTFHATLWNRRQSTTAICSDGAVQTLRAAFGAGADRVRREHDPARLRRLAADAAVSLVSNPDVRVRRQLAESLREWQVDTEPVRQALDTLRRDPDSGVRRAAGG